jgi:hypothetical protein
MMFTRTATVPAHWVAGTGGPLASSGASEIWSPRGQHARIGSHLTLRVRNLRNPYARAANSQSKAYASQRYKPPSKETIMLDVAFVALGCAVLALMGLYALTLRQL